MLIDKKEAAKRLRISTKTLERAVFAGTVACYRIGKRVLFETADLDAFLKRCRRPARADGGGQ